MALHEAQRIPRSTYRVQLNPQFTFADLQRRVGYLAKLGISDCYMSPILQPIPGSTHGYDVADYRRINPELGGEPAFLACAAELSSQGMGLLVDFVPNHMGISGPFNAWWNNVLENGRHSPYARFFDVNWRATESMERPRILVPVLEDHYGIVLEKGGLKLEYENGGLRIASGPLYFPLNAAAYSAVLARLSEDAALSGDDRQKLTELLQSFRQLEPGAYAWTSNPELPERLKELKTRLFSAVVGSETIRTRLTAHLDELNGKSGEAGSFDRLDQILSAQSFRLSRWKTGIYAVNYRRFFAVDTLIGLRIENPEVFLESHALIALLLKERKITGLRIDHIDGLWDPQQYLEQLQKLRAPSEVESGPAAPLYVVVEKILERGENLPSTWAMHGTTGYEFITQCAGLFTRAESRKELTRYYRDFTGENTDFSDLVYEKKRLVLGEMFVNTLTHLTAGLFLLLTEDRHWRDLTRAELAIALRELLAAFSVYRTYRRLGEPVADQDRALIEKAYLEAVRRNPRFDVHSFEIVRDVLTGEYPDRSDPPERREQIERWVLGLQQYSGAIMAKSVEDTAFYLYNRLIALNEVGGDPAEFGLSLEEFHAANRERAIQAPHSLLATSTHDNKLSEDVRARLYPLSELPEDWRLWLHEWRGLNQAHKTTLDGHPAPDSNEEFRLYQALLGAWPLGATEPDEDFRKRIREYFRKAVNEAKLNTTWVEPNEAWLDAGDKFIDRMLSPDTGRDFLASISAKAARLSHLGMVNSLTQTTLKLTCPGVPDFYQGNEVWDFSLVDPDNRRPVDFDAREQLLAQAEARDLRDLLLHWQDGAAKLRVVHRLLTFRADHPELFADGDYVPLEAAGQHAYHAVAFARRRGADRLVVVVPRQTARLGCPPIGLMWTDTTAVLARGTESAGEWREVISGRTIAPADRFALSELLADFPVAVLYSAQGATGE
ncbi:MAG TPA: malto-oligosyltrehalose synthase [Opitutaceae bacterium]|jgi:(1->4)-alpha-D-glucan 1-alpha-D-glucosylmutase